MEGDVGTITVEVRFEQGDSVNRSSAPCSQMAQIRAIQLAKEVFILMPADPPPPLAWDNS